MGSIVSLERQDVPKSLLGPAAAGAVPLAMASVRGHPEILQEAPGSLLGSFSWRISISSGPTGHEGVRDTGKEGQQEQDDQYEGQRERGAAGAG